MRAAIVALLAVIGLQACGGEVLDDGRDALGTTTSESALTKRPKGSQNCGQRHPGVTGVRAVLSVDEYKGVRSGRNGKHEIIEATISNLEWVYDSSVIDTNNVSVALNIASRIDPAGLPCEKPLQPGDTFEIQGEFIPAATANYDNGNGPAAVIHYTHAPCGFAVLDGVSYP